MKFKNIKKLRLENNLTQEEIAKISGVSRTTYTGWELGTNIIPLRKLFLLSNYYKCSIDYITGLSKINNFEYPVKNITIKVIGNNLRLLRKKVNLTQKEIAKILKISVSAYTQYELGIILIPTVYIYKLAKKFNCSVDEIIKNH